MLVKFTRHQSYEVYAPLEPEFAPDAHAELTPEQADRILKAWHEFLACQRLIKMHIFLEN